MAGPGAAPVGVADPEPPCPACGRTNPPGRRFCAHCGHQLATATAVASAPPPPVATRGVRAWWARRFDSRDRAARRAYRRSLPPLYRWRRALIGLGLVAGLVAGLAVAGNNPISFVRARYYDLRGTTAIVPVSTTAVEPPEATVPKSDPAALTDRAVTAWTMRWEPTAEGASCGGAPNTGVIVLTIPPTRIRTLGITAGLPEADGRRLLQARPLMLGVTLDGGTCQPLQLTDTAAEQVLKLDSKVPVSQIRIGIDGATRLPEGGEPALSLTEITIRAARAARRGASQYSRLRLVEETLWVSGRGPDLRADPLGLLLGVIRTHRDEHTRNLRSRVARQGRVVR